MNTRLTYRLARWLPALMLGFNLALGSQAAAAMEEVTVNGAEGAARERARQARFEVEMEAYAEAVAAEYRGLLQARLERSIDEEIAGAAAVRPGIRGWLGRLFDRSLHRDRREIAGPSA